METDMDAKVNLLSIEICPKGEGGWTLRVPDSGSYVECWTTPDGERHTDLNFFDGRTDRFDDESEWMDGAMTALVVASHWLKTGEMKGVLFADLATPSTGGEPASTALTMRKSSNLDNWYIIERKVHDGSVVSARRISDACVEGGAREMLAIAAAIEASESVSFGRCAVDARGRNEVEFYSPRNSRKRGAVPYKDALALAEEIRATLGAGGGT